MSTCLFCLKECHNASDEHVFPAALGGVLTVKSGSCTECNNGFSKFEQALARELAPVRLLFQIRDRYDQVPKVDAIARTERLDYAARVVGDGTVRIKPVVEEVKREDGKREFIYRFMTHGQREALRAEARVKGLELVETASGDPVQAEIHIGGELEVIGSEEGLRAVAKMAYVGLAYRMGEKTAVNRAFDGIRTYIRTGADRAPVSLFVHERFATACQLGPHHHSLIIAGRHDRKRVDAIVRLFGNLCYFVTLSEEYEGADVCDTVLYNSQRKEVDEMLFSNIQAELLQAEDVLTSGETIWRDVGAAGRAFCEFLNREVQAKLARDRSRSVGEAS